MEPKFTESVKEKCEDVKNWWGRKVEAMNVWYGENKKVAGMITLMVVGGLVDIAKSRLKGSRAIEEKQDRMNTYYDNQTGMTYYTRNHTKRKHNRVNQEILDAREYGVSAGDVLRKNHMLK